MGVGDEDETDIPAASSCLLQLPDGSAAAIDENLRPKNSCANPFSRIFLFRNLIGKQR
jgi:hypothetical protein